MKIHSKIAALFACLSMSAGAQSLSDYGAIPQVTKPQQDQIDANEKLDFHTDPFTGRFSYSIPIGLPPARDDSEPGIALEYNSANKNGWCGVGWDLQLGYIQRDTRHGVIASFTGSGRTGTASYTNSMGFIYSVAGKDGRLISVTTNDFRPQIDADFLKFWFSNNVWTVTDKGGRVYNFGETTASRITNSLGTFKWALSSIYDPNGNQTVLTYTNRSQLYLKEIDYNGNTNGIATNCTVLFDLTNRADAVSSAISGKEIITSNLLGSVRVFSQGQFVRRYQIAYAASQSTGRSLIQKVTEYGSDNTTTLPAHTFGYSIQSASFQYPPVAWSITPETGSGIQMPWGITPANADQGLVDLNGDGLPDWVTVANGSPYATYNVQFNTGSGFGSQQTWSSLENEGSDQSLAWNGVDNSLANGDGSLSSVGELIDINGDFIPDRVSRAYVTTGSPYNHFQVQTNTGTGFSSEFSMTGVTGAGVDDTTPNTLSDNGLYSICLLADMNGDGLPDRVWTNSSSGTFNVQLNQGGSFGSALSWQNVTADTGGNAVSEYSPRDRTTPDGNGNAYFLSDLIDMNGDGLPDRVLQGGVQLNNGVNGFASEDTTWGFSGTYPGQINIGSTFQANLVGLIDMNGDGLPDFVFSNSNGTYTVYFNTGRGFASGVTWNGVDTTGNTTGSLQGWDQLQAWDANGSRVMFIDMNGDGLPDRVERDYNNGNDILVQLNSGPFPDLLIAATNGIGGVVSVAYTNSTAFNNSDGTRPRLPFPVYAVTSVTTLDGHGNSGTSGYTTSYSYANGLYDTVYREFRGFGFVTQTNPSGTFTLTWFHQGGGTNGTALGEYNDDLSKAGMPYRVENYGSDNKLYTRTINLVNEVEMNNNGVFFPFTAQTITEDFEGNSGSTAYRATAQGFAYNAVANNLGASTGNLIEETNYGEVGGVTISNHTFSVSNTVPPFYKEYTYATIPSNTNIIDLVASATVSADSAGSTVLRRTTNSYFDVTGNLKTKNDLICSGTFATTSYTYDNYGNVATLTDPVFVVATTTYDSATATYPVLKYTGSLTNGFQYDTRSGEILYHTNEQGMVTENLYDVFFRPTNTLVSITNNSAPTLLRVKYLYNLGGIVSDNSSNYVQVSKNDPSDATGFHVSYTFLDGLLRPIQTREESEVSGQYRVSNIAYDPCGGVTLQEYPFFDSGAAYKKYTTARTNVYTQYDPLDRPFIVNPAATGTYNSSGWWNKSVSVLTGDSGSPVGPTGIAFKNGSSNPWAIIVTNALGNIHEYFLDAYGRTNQIVEVTSQGNYTTTLGYDLLDDLTNITDNAGNTISFYYDMLGREVAMTDPDMGFWQYGHDAAGRLTVQTDAKGQQIKFYYSDSAGRLTLREGLNTANQVVSSNSFVYDSSGGDSSYTVYPGQLFETFDDQGWEKSSYDVRDRTLKTVRYLSQNGNTYTNQFSFDDADRAVSQIYPNSGPTITNLFDTGEHLSQVQQVGGSGTVYYTAAGFNGLGQLLGVNYGNGVKTTNSYYLLSRRLDQITTLKTTNIQSLTYTFDADGNVKSIMDGVYTGTNSDTFGNIQYDSLNRLISLTNAAGSFSYGFDSVGNILTNGEFGSGAYAYSTDGIRPYAVRSANGAWYTYDFNGNIVFRSGQRLNYDVNNRLSQVIATNGLMTTFGYDADGARLWKLTSTNTLQVWIDGNYEEKDGKILFHILAGGHTVCTFDSTGTNVFEYYHDDLLTSTAIQTDQNGNQIQNFGYTAFGKSRVTESSSVFPVSRRYTGQVLDDDTGLYYYNTRYYDPQLARFVQPDDYISDLADPQSYNRYAYCLGDPLRYTDPNGKWGQEAADWWSDKVNTAADAYSAGPSHWIWNGTVGTLNSIIGGLSDPLRLGSSAGELSGEGHATAGKIILTTIQEGGRAAAIVPVGKVIGEGSGLLVNTLRGSAEKEAAGELTGALGGCFVAGTMVPTENGNVEIQNVKVGDRVWSYSFQDNEWQLREVEATPVRDYDGDVITVSVGDVTFQATGNHPFWVVAGTDLASRPPARDVPENERELSSSGRWVEGRSLQVGDQFFVLDGGASVITAVSATQERVTVYNLRVEGNHTYAVSEGGILVHNKAAQIKPVPGEGPHFSGTEKPLTKGATPNSTYTHIDPKTGKAVQNAIYDSEGKVVGHVDFKNHGPDALSGHGHAFPEPGNPASGHGPGKPHIPNNQLPAGWDKLPTGVKPHTPIGQ